MWPAAVAGCSLLTDLSGFSEVVASGDAGGDSATDALTKEAAADAPPPSDAGRCDPTKPFGAPVALAALNLPAENDRAAQLTPDELTIYFSSDRSNERRIYRATRARVEDPFGPPALLDELTTPSYDFLTAAPSADGLELIVEVRGLDGGTGRSDLRRLTRASTAVLFGSSTDISSVNTGEDETDPHLGAAGLELWFARRVAGKFDIFVSSRSTLAAAFGSPSPLAGVINAPSASETDPVPSADRTELFFQTDRDGTARVWVAHRSSVTEPFGTPVHVTELDGPGTNDVPNWLSPDRCVLYLTSYRENAIADLYVATRPH